MNFILLSLCVAPSLPQLCFSSPQFLSLYNGDSSIRVLQGYCEISQYIERSVLALVIQDGILKVI